jgi:hypothetical protein
MATHVTPAEVSDLLGGASPVGLLDPDNGFTYFVRETCLTDGSVYNPTASIFASVILESVGAPLRGPVVLTSVLSTTGQIRHANHGHRVGLFSPTCFEAEEVDPTVDLLSALHLITSCQEVPEHLAKFVTDGYRGTLEEFRARIRTMDDGLQLVTLPEGFPFPAGGQGWAFDKGRWLIVPGQAMILSGSDTPPATEEDVEAILAKLGVRVRPEPGLN